MTATAFRESTAALLRPAQVDALTEEVRRLEGELNAPAFIQTQIRDRTTKRKQLQQLRRDLANQAPKPYEKTDLDAAARRHAELLDEIKAGMPTQAEMRRRPVGAVEKHMTWERRNKERILELKNIRLRLHASGALDGVGDAGEVSNIERFRPRGGPGELNMDGTLIAGRDFHLPPAGAALPALLDPDELSRLRDVDADMADRVSCLTNDQRALVKDFLAKLGAEPGASAVNVGAPLDGRQRAGKSRRAGAPSEIGQLRARAKELGLNSYAKSAVALKEMIRAAEVAASVTPQG